MPFLPDGDGDPSDGVWDLAAEALDRARAVDDSAFALAAGDDVRAVRCADADEARAAAGAMLESGALVAAAAWRESQSLTIVCQDERDEGRCAMWQIPDDELEAEPEDLFEEIDWTTTQALHGA